MTEFVDYIAMNLDPTVQPSGGSKRRKPPRVGHYDFAISALSFDVSRSGNRLLVVTFTVISGPELSREVRQQYVVAQTNFARRRMKSLVQAACIPLDTSGGFRAADLINRTLCAEVSQREIDQLDERHGGTGMMIRRVSATVVGESPLIDAKTGAQRTWTPSEAPRRPPPPARNVTSPVVVASPVASIVPVPIAVVDTPSVTAPPINTPSVAPLVTAPPVTASPVTASPVTAPPITAPPINMPLIVDSVITAAPITAPPVTVPLLPITAPFDDRKPVLSQQINNQGRVRSDNVAAYEEDGLRFRSWPEICVHRALCRFEITYAPLPVFLRSDGMAAQRIEPDFLIYKRPHVIVIEVDGPRHTERPTDASDRVSMLTREGAIIERVDSWKVDTDEKAFTWVRQMLHEIYGKDLYKT